MGLAVLPAVAQEPDPPAPLPAWSFRTGSPGGHTGAPLAAGGRLFVPTPFPHALHALDAASGRVLWTFRPRPDPMAEGYAAGGPVSTAPVEAGGRLYLNTLDGHTLALDAATGTVIWDVATARVAAGETLASAPLVARGRVLVGGGGDDFGARGFIAALDAASGRELWRRFSTGPDAEVGIGPDFRGPGGADLGIRTWPPAAWQQGGGAVSGPLLYDPDADLVFHGTGHPAPWNPDQRPGDNRWTSGLFARDLDTGAARWFVPLNPHDLYALGGTAPSLLVDRDWQGAPRKLLIHPDANGILYVLDRLTGEILSAEPFASVNATTGVDRATGALKRDPSKATRFQVMARSVCPAWIGAAGGTPALSPDAALIYLPVRTLCMDIEARNASYVAGTAFVGANVRVKAAAGVPRGALVAWDLAAGKPAWSVPETFPLGGGVRAIDGGLVVYGTLDGVLKAVDARSGRPVWQHRLPSGVVGDPAVVAGPDGSRLLAVLAGLGGPLGQAARAGIDRRDATAARGMANALPDLPRPEEEGGVLAVFRLP
ncbi:outer membrane protein assembly factor BamB family protein [Methylobacterium sp. ID0610]|uniref:outer membrane protein assembly factor BamB family protein n=1 Tax=Methylobacterium carpenticola TaxID=3344827 RepID=UPI00368018EF